MSELLRVYQKPIQYLLSHFPCVVILGARQVGKSTLLKQVWPTTPLFDLERERDFELIEKDPEFFLNNYPSPLIFDEAQLSPRLFSALRVHIDKNRKQNGQFLISGSSSPDLLKNISESLAGRVAILEIGTLHWEEAWKGFPSPFYKWITEGSWNELLKLKPLRTKEQLYELCFFGGYPEAFLNRHNSKVYGLWMENYIKTYLERDVRRLFPRLKMETYRRLLKMLTFSSGHIINFSDFARSLDVSQPTIKLYFDIAEGTFLWRTLPSFHKKMSKRVVKMPKGHLRDTGLICFFLNIKTKDDLKSHPQFGTLWEVFVLEQIIKGLKTTLTPFQISYYRTHHQAEIDLIIENHAGLIPIEIKAGITIQRNQIQTLETFIKTHQCPCGILINNSQEVLKISEKIFQIPATCL